MHEFAQCSKFIACFPFFKPPTIKKETRHKSLGSLIQGIQMFYKTDVWNFVVFTQMSTKNARYGVFSMIMANEESNCLSKKV